MSALLRFLLCFLSLGAEGEGGGGDDTGAASAEASGGEAEVETTLDDFLDQAERQVGGKGAAPTETTDPSVKASQDAIARAEAAERRANEAEARERQLRDQYTPPAQPQRDPQFDQEEQALAAAKAAGQDTTWLAWKIQTDRQNRELLRNVASERFASQEERDRAQFERIETTHPKLFAKYRDKVEQARAMSVKGNQPIPRMALLDLLVGHDMRTGALKVSTRKSSTTTETNRTVRADRGRVPGARTDVDARQKKSEREARRERLRNQFI